MHRALLATLLAFVAAPAAAQADLTTTAERSGFARTARYDEAIALCRAFAARHADAVRCTSFGTTPEGRPMQVLVATRTGAFTPEAARARSLPVLLVQGGIHAGEIDGKDAGFIALRDVLDGKAARGALDRQVLLFVPVFSVDGHERFRAWNRPNQRGPEEMGWRATARNLNLNRDYAKADAPEMQAMLGLVEAWDPLLVVDLHVTNGAQFEHDISIQVEPGHSGDARLRTIGRTLRDGVMARLARQGSLPLPFYPSFVRTDDPMSGFEDGVSPPRFSTGYFPLRNRFAMLVETHSWKDYATRVRATRNTVVAVLEAIARDGAQWRREAMAADARASALAGTAVPLEWRATDAARTIEFRGYAYTRTPSDVSGALMTRYDESTPQVWKVPLRDTVVPAREAVAPRAGYLVPAAHAARIAPRLALHGIRTRTLPDARTALAAQAFRATRMQFAAASVEGRQRLTLDGAWAPETVDIAAGALFVPIDQPKARLAMALLEPQAPDSYAAWGDFNAHFEQKEYIEDYVAEAFAREMLAREPALRAEFDARVRDDAAFARDPQARLDFFYRRHDAWDERYGLYPVLRLDVAP